MAVDISDDKHLVEIVNYKIFTIQRVLEDIERSTPGFGPLFFLEALKAIVESIKATFVKNISNFNTTHYKHLKTECFKYLSHLHLIQSEFLPIIQNTENEFLRSELLPPLNKLIQQFQKEEGVSLYIKPFCQHNYEFLCYVDFVKKALKYYDFSLFDKELQNRINKFPKWFIFISYPLFEHKNILLHTLIVHEVGHFIEYYNELQKKALKYIELDQELANKLVNELLNIPATVSSGGGDSKQLTLEFFIKEEELKNRVTERCALILNNWLKEFISDLLALRYMGPCYFFALYELSNMSGGADGFSDSHPSFRIRLLKLLEELEDLGFIYLKTDNQKTIIGYINKLRDVLNKKIQGPQDEHQNIVYNSLVLPDHFKNVQKMIRNFVPLEHIYDISRYNEDVNQLVGSLKEGLPPCETRDSNKNNIPASIPSILNAGWDFYLHHINSFFQLTSASLEEEKIASIDNFNELLLKAIESSHILSVWQDREKENGHSI